MIIYDLNNNNEMLNNLSNIRINRKINEAETLSFTALKIEGNDFYYNLIQNDNFIEVNNTIYVIKSVSENPYSKNVTAVNEFFENVNEYVNNFYPSGFSTLSNALSNVFSSSDWSFVIDGNINNNLILPDYGNENLISALNKILSTFNVEYEINNRNKTITVKRNIGVITDYQIRYMSNLVNIERNINSENVKTRVQVFYNRNELGEYTNQITYNSPNINRYRRPKIMEPIYSDVTNENDAINIALAALEDNPTVTISLDFLLLQNIGYEANEYSLGNQVYLIEERLNINQLARITEIEEYFSLNSGQLIANEVLPNKITISSVRKNIVNDIVSQRQEFINIDRSSVKQRTFYNGCNISPEQGFTTVASNGVKTYQNSTEGFRITVNDVNQFFVDPINRQLTLDGRLLITNNQNPLFDGFNDENGGVLRIYDNAGHLNATIGSNSSLLDTTGGDITLYEDNGSRRARMFVRRADDSGELTLYNGTTTLPKVNISANVSNSNMILLYDDQDEVKTSIGIERGEINNSRIVTREILDPIVQGLEDEISDLRRRIRNLEP